MLAPPPSALTVRPCSAALHVTPAVDRLIGGSEVSPRSAKSKASSSAAAVVPSSALPVARFHSV